MTDDTEKADYALASLQAELFDEWWEVSGIGMMSRTARRLKAYEVVACHASKIDMLPMHEYLWLAHHTPEEIGFEMLLRKYLA